MDFLEIPGGLAGFLAEVPGEREMEAPDDDVLLGLGVLAEGDAVDKVVNIAGDEDFGEEGRWILLNKIHI